MNIPEQEHPSRSIPLTRGLIALVSPEDHPLVSQFKWYAMKANGKFYAVRKSPMVNGGKRQQILLHRFLLGLEYGDPRQGDHVDNAATLDNRRSNIRIATHAENTWNASRRKSNRLGLKGVSVDRKASKNHRYRARITVNGTGILIGAYATPEEAHQKYCEAAFKHFGKFARSA